MDCLSDSFTPIAQILAGKKEGQAVNIRGWVHRARSSGGLAFVILRDSSGIIQCAVKKGVVPDASFEAAKGIYVESSVMVSGTPKKDERAPGGWEIGASDFSTIHLGTPFPIAKDQSVEFLMDTRHLWLRSQKLTKVMKLRDYATRSLRHFFEQRGFFECVPPIITKSACEGGSTLFELDYFGTPAYLSQSGQMYAESYMQALEKVYILAPSFRAEPSRTVRHLSEYWHLEPEMAFYNQKMNMQLQEDMIVHVCQDLGKNHADLLTDIGRDPAKLLAIKGPFPRLSYEDAIKKCQELDCKIDYGQDLGADEEAVLTKQYEQPLFIHNHLKAFKAFYMREDPNKPGTVLSADLLAPEGHGEIIGGSERIWDKDELLARMKEQNLPLADYQWYVDLRTYGSVPHAGFGLGIERLCKWMFGLDHIRDTIPFPRTINRVYP
ncbi:Asparagine--tRNA ligase [uncultured archaeon]|nr:Asparagine--tRNA ligase [uncultured archaeon]